MILPFSLYPRTWNYADRPPIDESMDQPGVSMEIEDHRFVWREDGLELIVRQTVRMLRIRDQLEQVKHVHEPHFSVRQVFAQDCRCSQRLRSRQIATLAMTTSGSTP